MNDYEIIGNDYIYAEVHSKGGYVNQILVNGKKILKKADDVFNMHGGIPILIPYGDLIKDAKYKFMGKWYYLPRNAYFANNYKDSIHGFVRSKELYVNERSSDYISLEANVSDPGYPTILDVNLSYKVMKQSFDVNMKITNIGQNEAPIVAGAHPYFLVSHPWRLFHTGKIKMLNYPDGIFPDGTMLEYNFNSLENTERLNLDNTFYGGGSIKLESGLSTIILERRNMDYFEVYNGPFAGKNSVALEPLTGAINAYNNGIGLKILSPGEALECGFTISISIS